MSTPRSKPISTKDGASAAKPAAKPKAKKPKGSAAPSVPLEAPTPQVSAELSEADAKKELDSLQQKYGVLVVNFNNQQAELKDCQISGHPLAGVEVNGSFLLMSGCKVRRCGQAGVLISAGGTGTIRDNHIGSNLGSGIECCSQEHSLTVEGNFIHGHAHGAGLLLRAGCHGTWIGNSLTGNQIGVDVADSEQSELRQHKINGNTRAGVRVQQGAGAAIIGCQIRGNGFGCVVKGGRRGERTIGDDSGAGVVVQDGGKARLDGNTVSGNAGVGVFAHAQACIELNGNVFRNNQGGDVSGRPSSSTVVSRLDIESADSRRAITPTIARGQRTPFDWTMSRTALSADDRTLADRTAEVRARYRAMSANHSQGQGPQGLELPEGIDASAICTVS